MASQVTERRLSVSPVTLRQERATGSVAGATRLEGYAALFNVKALISERGIQFYERVAPGAFALSVLEDDQRIAYNHDASRILGRRSAGTATIHEDARGLFYSVLINPLDPAAMSVMAQVQRRDVSGSSFQFVLLPEDETWEYGHTGAIPLRTIHRARVIELGPVSFPAYVQTSVTARQALRRSAGTTRHEH